MEIKLPPLPEQSIDSPWYTVKQMRHYAIAAVELDRAQRGEPSQPGREHTESEVQEILRDDWNMSQDKLENTVRRILGVPKP